MTINTRLEWWSELARFSPTFAHFNQPVDEHYWNCTENTAINATAFNLANCQHHTTAIARWIELLLKNGASISVIEKLVIDITSRNTYGAFSELAAYGWLLDSNVPFDIQVPMKGSEILNPNGSDLDGALQITTPVFFDVKAFGLYEQMSNELNNKLTSIFRENFVAIEGSGDSGVGDLQPLLARQGFDLLVNDLKADGRADRAGLKISIVRKRPVQSTVIFQNPYALAENNALHAFRFAKQFVRTQPFILIFVLHPWLGAFRLTTNFTGDADKFTRSFARRTFMQFRDDQTDVFGLPRSDVAGLLSGMLFIDGSQLVQKDTKSHRFFLNPYATNPLPRPSRDRLASIINVAFDDFAHDAY